MEKQSTKDTKSPSQLIDERIEELTSATCGPRLVPPRYPVTC